MQPEWMASRFGWSKLVVPGGMLARGALAGTQPAQHACHAPVALAQGVQAQLVCYLRGVHCVGQVLLVRKHEEHRVAQLILQVRGVGGVGWGGVGWVLGAWGGGDWDDFALAYTCMCAWQKAWESPLAPTQNTHANGAARTRSRRIQRCIPR